VLDPDTLEINPERTASLRSRPAARVPIVIDESELRVRLGSDFTDETTEPS
jgi:hypothetical protein